MSEENVYLVTWAYYSEAASVAVVRATNGGEARRRAAALADEKDPHNHYVRDKVLAMADIRLVDGDLLVQVDAPH